MRGVRVRICIGADHAGYTMKESVKAHLSAAGHTLTDVGAFSEESVDYPVIAEQVGRAVAAGDAEAGVLVCGTGLGMAIAANKVAGIRAVTAHDSFSVERAVLSNNAQVLTFGQRVIGLELARRLLKEWLTYRFDEGSASALKVKTLSDYERVSAR